MARKKRRITTSRSRPDAAALVQCAIPLLIFGWSIFAMLYREGMRRWDEYISSPASHAVSAQMWTGVRPAKYVTDDAGVMDTAVASRLNEMLASFERETSNQVVVYVSPSMPDGTIDQIANESYNAWQIGQKGRDNGVLFLVFLHDREMRIEVGYGLEGVLTDAKSKRILENVVKPFFKRDAYSEGIEAGTRAIVDTVRGEGNAGDGQTVSERAVLMGMTAKSFGKKAAGFVIVMTGLGFVLFAASLVLLALQRTFNSGGRRFNGGGSSGSWATSSSRSSSSSSSSSSSRSSGYSGGGGRSGGGGASSSW
ncbi:MAG TPA: TPM domain-containing protein [Thermoanaerobaculia bacterium]|nr:TPM domain-containing protein [Thermoanaerobaculia bacterium]